MKNLFKRFLKNESGATAIEYGLIAGLVAVAIITAFAFFSDDLSAIMSSISTSMNPPTTP